MSVPLDKFEVKAHSNIALIKYWGKKNFQEPINPSLSFTLKKSLTSMKVEVFDYPSFELEYEFEGKENKDFSNKILQKLSKVDQSFLKPHKLRISSENTFPHSAGIASSASSMCCLSKALCRVSEVSDEKKISSLARELSGSASRSVYNGFSVWGKTDLLDFSSDQYAVRVNVSKDFYKLKDYILITSDKEKAVSSSLGHNLFAKSLYKDARVQSAENQFLKLYEALMNSHWKDFSDVVSEEALELHGLMLLSKPGFSLLNERAILLTRKLEKLRAYFEYKLTYTLDAGPNIHLIFDESIQTDIERLLESPDFDCLFDYIIKDEILCERN